MADPATPLIPVRAPRKKPQPGRVRAGRSIDWFMAGWRGFVEQPIEWALMALATFLLMAAVSTLIVPLPIIGPIVAPVVLALLSGGLLHASQRQAEGNKIRFSDLFAGCRQHGPNLALVGVFYSVPLVLMSLVTLLAIGGGLLVGLLGTALGEPVRQAMDGLLTLISALAAGWLFSIVALLLMMLALISAPALVMFSGTPSWDAMRLSLRASTRNLGATLLFGVLLYLLFALAMIPAGLGVLIVIPVAAGALRQSYLDMFVSAPHSASVES